MTLSRQSLLEEVKRLALTHRHNGESYKDVEEYILGFYDRFYLYVKNGELRGYADYYIIDKTVYIYDLVCNKGCIRDMWKYCKDQMKELGINRIVFRKPNEEKRSYQRRF